MFTGSGNTFIDIAIVIVIYFLWWTFCTSWLFKWFRNLLMLLVELFFIAMTFESDGNIALGIFGGIAAILVFFHPMWLSPLIKGIVGFIKEKISI